MSCIHIYGNDAHLNAKQHRLAQSMPQWSPRKAARQEDMSRSHFASIREVAANHPRATPEQMNRLMSDPEVTVRRAAVRNVSITYENMVYMTYDSDPGIAAYAAMMVWEMADG